MHDLGGEPGHLVRRDREIAELRRLAGSRRLVTLTGPGGIGKTSLLRDMVATMAADFPDGAFVVPLGDFWPPALVPAQVAESLGICEEPGVPVTATLAAALADRRLLLALDGTEPVTGACASMCQNLLASAPGLMVIAAGRQPLGVPGEAIWPVPPLDRPLGGVPLALELAAARLGSAGIGPVMGAPAGPEAALAAVLQWTHDLLDPAGQVLLRRLSVFNGWSLEMAQRVCADAGLPAARVAGVLDGLAAAALVSPDPGAAPDRYRMPGAVRDFAAARLVEAGETAMMQRRLRDHIAHLADYAASISTSRVPAAWPIPPEVCRRFAGDAANFRAVLTWCLEQGDAETGLRICTALRLSWLMQDARSERSWWLDALGAAADDHVPAAVRGPALAARAQLALDGNDLDRARACGEAGLDLCRAAGETRISATALDLLARVAVHAGRPQEALRYSGESIELARASDDPWTRAFPMGSRAIALAALGRLDEGTHWAQAGLDVMQGLDNQWGVAFFRLGLGNLAWASGALAAAREHFLAALPFARQYMSAPRTTRCLACLGRVALAQGDLDAARRHLADSLSLSRESGFRAGTIRALRGFAELAVQEGRPGRAVQLAAAVTTQAEAAGRPPLPAGWAQRYRDAGASLGEGAVARLWAEGLGLTSRAAADLALEPPALPLAGSRLAG